jgi:hypothetical protein
VQRLRTTHCKHGTHGMKPGGAADDGPVGARRRLRVLCGVCRIQTIETTKLLSNPVCGSCAVALKETICGGCGKAVLTGPESPRVSIAGRLWHKQCAAAFGYGTQDPLQPAALEAQRVAAPGSAGNQERHSSFMEPVSFSSTAFATEPYGHMFGATYSSVALKGALDARLMDTSYKRLQSHATNTSPHAAESDGDAFGKLKLPHVPLPFESAFVYDAHHPPSKPFLSYSLEGIVRRIQAMGLLRERTYRFKTYRGVFIGREFVDYLMCTRQCATRVECVTIGKLLLHHGMIVNVTGDKGDTFEDKDSALYIVTLKRKRNAKDDILAESMTTSALQGPVGVVSMPASSSAATPKRSFFGTPFKRTAAVAPMPPSAPTDPATSSFSPTPQSTELENSMSLQGRFWDAKDSDPHRYSAPEDGHAFIGMAEEEMAAEPTEASRRKQRVGEMSTVDEDDDRYHSDGSLPDALAPLRSNFTTPAKQPLRHTKSASHLRSTSSGPLSPKADSEYHEEDDFVDASGAPSGTALRKSSSGNALPALLSAAAPRSPTGGTLGDAVAEARRLLITRRIELESRMVQEGWMVKQGHKFKSWKRRYFVLTGYDLTYFRKGPHLTTGLTGMSPAGT